MPIYSFLNEIASKNKHFQQFKAQYNEEKHICMVTSMYTNKMIQQLLGDILVALQLPLERIVAAIQQLEGVPVGEQSPELIHMQGVILSELKDRLQHEDYFNTIVKEAIQHAKLYALNMQN